jgi:site-specific recombinase XerD
MIEDMQVRNLAPHTQATYILHVSLFARHFCKSPELLGPEEMRDYQLYLTNQRKLAPSSIVVTTAALRFLYNVTLKRGWNLEVSIPAPRQPKKLPVVLSRAEVLHFLGCVEDVKHHAILTTCYAAGLRISEAVRLKASSLDNQRMVIRVAQGKGRKDYPDGSRITPCKGECNSIHEGVGFSENRGCRQSRHPGECTLSQTLGEHDRPPLYLPASISAATIGNSVSAIGRVRVLVNS